MVAAALLTCASRRVLVAEANQTFGGAVHLAVELRSRSVASYSPVGDGGILAMRGEDEDTRRSFHTATGSDQEYEAWQHFHAWLADFAAAVAPT